MRFYFDHNACTPVDPRVLARFVEIEQTCSANPGSLHGAGRHARGIVEAARCSIADRLGVAPDQVFFVSGGTEANNWMVLGAGDLSRPVLASAVEHPSTLAAASERGLLRWTVDSHGSAVIAPPDRPVGLLALTHGQNEVGTIQPVSQAAELARQLGVPLHVDASQSLGRLAIEDVVTSADSITFSTHKAAGLRGCGVLIDRGPTTRPLLFGGGQQLARRPGTESASLIAATALAFELAIAERSARAEAMAAARDAFATTMLTSPPLEATHNLTPFLSLPNTMMVLFENVDGRELLPALDMAGVEASLGSACSSGSPMPPAVLLAMGLDGSAARSCVRFSFSHQTTPEYAAEGARVVKRVVRSLRACR